MIQFEIPYKILCSQNPESVLSSFSCVSQIVAHDERSPNAGGLVSKYGQDKFEDYELCGQAGGHFTEQSTGQQTSDYDDYSQTLQSPQEEFDVCNVPNGVSVSV